jgi:hypothetical protein
MLVIIPSLALHRLTDCLSFVLFLYHSEFSNCVIKTISRKCSILPGYFRKRSRGCNLGRASRKQSSGKDSRQFDQKNDMICPINDEGSNDSIGCLESQ